MFSAIIGFIALPKYEDKSISIHFEDHSIEQKGRDAVAVKTTTPAPKQKSVSKPKPRAKIAMVLPSQEEVAQKVKGVFSEDPETAVAVFRAESGLRANAQGWNCHYYNEQGTRYSAACLPQDRANAWSVDCGVAQINTPGNTCPEHLYDVETNLEEAYKKYVRRGWQPWVAHNQGKHLVFLEN